VVRVIGAGVAGDIGAGEVIRPNDQPGVHRAFDVDGEVEIVVAM
jgi:hypothetical protein